jgi:hypothetical protein
VRDTGIVKAPTRPRDTNELAKLIIGIATGEAAIASQLNPEGQPTRVDALATRACALGSSARQAGIRRARALTRFPLRRNRSRAARSFSTVTLCRIAPQLTAPDESTFASGHPPRLKGLRRPPSAHMRRPTPSTNIAGARATCNQLKDARPLLFLSWPCVAGAFDKNTADREPNRRASRSRG